MGTSSDSRGHPSLRTWGLDVAVAPVAIVAVHGRGQSSEVMREYSCRFGSVPARFYAPDAPGGSWYPSPFMDPIEANQPELDRALGTLEQTLDVVERDGFTRDRTIVWGFSQGACLLSQWMISRAPQIAGAILHTGGYLGPRTQDPGGLFPTKTQIIMRSIQQDPFVPARRVLETRDALRGMGARVDCRVDPGNEHIITNEAIQASASLVLEVRPISD